MCDGNPVYFNDTSHAEAWNQIFDWKWSINDVIIDPIDYNSLYIATDDGVFFTTNLGSSWGILADGIPATVPCHDLTLHAATRKLVVWTHGRSAYKLTLPNPPVSVAVDPIEKKPLYHFFPGSKILSVGTNGCNLECQFFPNPFNPSTKISWQSPVGSWQTLKIYDALGNEIATLVKEEKPAGSYEVEFNASSLSSGIYFYKLQAGSFVESKKMILIK